MGLELKTWYLASSGHLTASVSYKKKTLYKWRYHKIEIKIVRPVENKMCGALKSTDNNSSTKLAKGGK